MTPAEPTPEPSGPPSLLWVAPYYLKASARRQTYLSHQRKRDAQHRRSRIGVLVVCAAGLLGIVGSIIVH